jgi:hypothetical protein
VFNNNASSNTGNILLGQYQGVNEFAVDAKGDVTANGNVAAAGSVTIGTGGTPILKHMSVPQSLPSSFNGVKLAPGSCTVATFSFTSAADGDTIALGPSSLLMSANVVLSAWASNGNVNVRICNPTGTPTTLPVPPSGSALTIRIDLWKH